MNSGSRRLVLMRVRVRRRMGLFFKPRLKKAMEISARRLESARAIRLAQNPNDLLENPQPVISATIRGQKYIASIRPEQASFHDFQHYGFLPTIFQSDRAGI